MKTRFEPTGHPQLYYSDKGWHWVLLPWEQDKYIPESKTRDWCKKNCDGKWERERIFKVDEAIYFELESDKVKFILWL